MAASVQARGYVKKTLEHEQLHEEQLQPHRSTFPGLKSLLREPLLHFILIGAGLFAISGYMHHGRDGGETSKQIALSMDDLRQIDVYFESQWKRPPTPEEYRALVEEKIREEVLYREGIAMGLDRDDTIVKRRMAQKVEFLAEDVAAAHEPSTAELRAWFDKNQDKFAQPSRYSFRHLYFSPDKRGKNAQEDAVKALGKIASQPESSQVAASFADQFMFQDYYRDRTPEMLAKDFGPQFSVTIEKVRRGSWQGPIESGYGWHLVYVDTVIPGRIPAFEEIEPDVKTAWLGWQRAQEWNKAYAEMRAKYTVLLPGLPDKEAKPVIPATTPKAPISTPFEGPS